MKKIMALVFLLALISGACSAFEPPDPERWQLIKSTGKYEFWLDKETVRFTKEKYGVSANIWLKFHLIEGDIEKMENEEINLNRREVRTLSTYTVAEDGTQTKDEEEEDLAEKAEEEEEDEEDGIKEEEKKEPEFVPIVPGSSIEDLYNAVYKIYEDGGKKAAKRKRQHTTGKFFPTFIQVLGAILSI